MNEVAAVQPQERSLTTAMAEKYGMNTENFLATMKKTVMPSESVSNEHIAAFMMVAKEYDLNPFTEEIYAFPAKGGVKAMVGLDGWIKIANRQPAYHGIEHVDNFEDGELVSVTGIVHRKDHSVPTKITEYMDECKRSTTPWNQWPKRMLRHKAMIQAIRIAFGVCGIYEKDELERMEEEPDSFVPLNVTPETTKPLNLVQRLEEPEPKPKRTRSRKPKVTEPEPGMLIKEVGSEEVDKLFTKNISTDQGQQVEFTIEEEEKI